MDWNHLASRERERERESERENEDGMKRNGDIKGRMELMKDEVEREMEHTAAKGPIESTRLPRLEHRNWVGFPNSNLRFTEIRNKRKVRNR